MDRRTFFRQPLVPFDNVPAKAVEPKQELSSLDKAHKERAAGKGSLLGGGALLGSGVVVAGNEIATGSLDDPLTIAMSSLVSVVLLVSGRMSSKEGLVRLDLAHECAIKSGIERATAVKQASELKEEQIEPPAKKRHLHLVK